MSIKQYVGIATVVLWFCVPVWGFETFVISGGTGARYSPDIDGNLVVWSDNKTDPDYDIYGYYLSSETEFIICDNGAEQYRPAVKGNTVIWVDERYDKVRIRGRILPGSSEFAFGEPSWRLKPAVSDAYIVWTHSDSSSTKPDIWAEDRSTGIGFSVCNENGDQKNPDLDGNTAVWRDERNGEWDIYGMDLSTRDEFAVCTHSSSQGDPSISGNIVVWSDARNGSGDIFGKNLTTEEEFVICAAEGLQFEPDISGNLVVWQDRRSGSQEIWGADLDSGEVFPIAVGGSTKISPAISGNTVVWLESSERICGAIIPEPVSLSLLAVGAVTLIRRRRK